MSALLDEAFLTLFVPSSPYHFFFNHSYTQEIPSRYKKEVICAIDRNNDGFATLDDIDQLLVNIGAKGRVSRHNLEHALSELGMKRTSPLSPKRQQIESVKQRNREGMIPVEKLYALL